MTDNGKQSDPTIFPMPLSDSERLHWYRDSRRYPNVIFCHLKFSGKPDCELLESALVHILRRHPMYNVRLVQSKTRDRFHWEQANLNEPTIVWHRKKFDPATYQATPIDLKTSRALSSDAFVCEEENQVDFIFQIHHAAVDGLSGLQSVGDLFIIYDNLVNGRPANTGLRRLDWEQLLKRNRIGLFHKGWIRRLPFQWIPFYGAAKFTMARVEPLLAREELADEPLPDNFPTFITRNISDLAMKDLSDLAEKEGCTRNELIISALFKAVREWKTKNEIPGENKKLRVVIPINIREIGDRRCPACNRVTFIQLDRKTKEMSNILNLARGISSELGIIRRMRFDRFPNVVLRGMSWVPGLFKRIGEQRKCRATVVFTNLGHPFDRVRLPREGNKLRSGNMVLEQVEPAAAYYDQIPATILLSSYAEQYSLILHYDSRELSKELAQKLIDELLAQINGLVGQSS